MPPAKTFPKQRAETSSIRWTEDDWKLIAKLRKDTGLSSLTELVRMALRALERERAKR